MSSQPYTERFIAKKQSQGWTDYYVPLGKRAVVTFVSVTDVVLVTGHTQVDVAGTLVALVVFPASFRQVQMQLRAVAYGGEAISVFSAVVGMASFVGGYLFDDPARAAGAPAGEPPDPLERAPVALMPA